MKEKVNQLFKDKLFLVMLVLGLLTIVAAAGVVTIQRGSQPGEENPYVELQEPQGLIARDTTLDPTTPVAGASEAAPQEDTNVNPEPIKHNTLAEEAEESAENSVVAEVGTGIEAAVPLVLDFQDTSKMTWPIYGNVLLDYSMDTTIYFPTLDQYKCNPALVIQADVSQPVSAPANARVLEVGANEEIGHYVVLDFGNEYVATCGQLKEIQVVENEYMEQGQIIGYVAEPTKYYSIEGSNIYFELKNQDKVVDPLDYLQ